MPFTLETTVRIERTPAEVRAVVLDFRNWHQWHSSFLKALQPVPETKAPIELRKGDDLLLNARGIKVTVQVAQNDEHALIWEGGPAYLFHGAHFIRFEPADDGKATLVRHGEDFSGLFGYAIGLPGVYQQTRKLYEAFSHDLKRRCEEGEQSGVKV